MDFKTVAINLMVVGVLVLAIMSWTVITQTQNNPSQLITNNTLINQSYGDLTTNLNSAQSTGDNAEDTFGDITPSQSFGIVDVTSIVSPTRVYRTLIVGTFNILIELPLKILGVPPVVSGVVYAILFLLMILGIWAIWRGVAG